MENGEKRNKTKEKMKTFVEEDFLAHGKRFHDVDDKIGKINYSAHKKIRNIFS
jgi:hypothetical protein